MVARLKLVAAVGTLSVLSACGGGGGNVASTPTPTPAPPLTPSPPASQIASLTVTGDLANIASHAQVTYNLAANKVVESANKATGLQVHYDAESKSYTLTEGARHSTFSVSDAIGSSLSGETRYRKLVGNGAEYLTLVVKPYSGSKSNKYVGLGYWESILVKNGVQTSAFDIFAYGFPTAASSVPKSGVGRYAVDAFAMVAVPGQEPKALQGDGTFNVDFLAGVFSTEAYVAEYALASEEYGIGGNIVLRGAGQLDSGNGFSGDISYTGFLQDDPATFSHVAGTIQGNFFGPNAEELGASFIADNADGGHVTGALTGQRSTDSSPMPALALTNLSANSTFDTRSSILQIHFDTTTTPIFNSASGYDTDGAQSGKITLNIDGSLVVQPSYNLDPHAVFTRADLSDVQRHNFDSFDTDKATQFSDPDPATVHFDRYKIGRDNPELQLSYVGFGIWSQTFLGSSTAYGYASSRVENFEYILYGLETTKGLLSRRAGSASYEGVVYGNSATNDGTLQDVGGTSHFNVDFGAQSFSGSLDLTVGAVGGPKSALGTWTFSDHLVDGQLVMTELAPNASFLDHIAYNGINPRFYGPGGEEIGATFSIVRSISPPLETGGYYMTSITGVTVAKRK